MTSYSVTPVERAHDAFLRWQEVRINHLGYTVNIVLTLTTATLGFAVNLAVGKNVSPVQLCKYPFYTSIVSLLFAVGLGLLVNLSRLYDFRYSAKAARARELHERDIAGESLEEKDRKTVSQCDDFSKKADFCGKCTWCLLWFQMTMFMVGVVFLAYSVIQAYPLQ